MSYYDWTFGGLCLQNAGLVLRLVSWTFESLVSLITPHDPLRSPSWTTVLHFRCVRLSFQKKTRVSCCCFRVFCQVSTLVPNQSSSICQRARAHSPAAARAHLTGTHARSRERPTWLRVFATLIDRAVCCVQVTFTECVTQTFKEVLLGGTIKSAAR